MIIFTRPVSILSILTSTSLLVSGCENISFIGEAAMEWRVKSYYFNSSQFDSLQVEKRSTDWPVKQGLLTKRAVDEGAVGDTIWYIAAKGNLQAAPILSGMRPTARLEHVTVILSSDSKRILYKSWKEVGAQ